jgi:hypothetical protein
MNCYVLRSASQKKQDVPVWLWYLSQPPVQLHIVPSALSQALKRPGREADLTCIYRQVERICGPVVPPVLMPAMHTVV